MKRIITSTRHFLTGNPAKRIAIRRRVVRLSLPVLLSSLLQRLVSIIDIFMVGGWERRLRHHARPGRYALCHGYQQPFLLVLRNI